MNIKELINSKKFKAAITVIALAVVVLAVFQVGVFVGFKKASFAKNWGDNYYRTFGRPQNDFKMPGMPKMDIGLTDSHGVAGRVLRVAPPRLMIESPEKIEKSVIIGDKTIIRRFRDNVDISSIQQDEFVVVLGSPNETGEIEAGFVRLMPHPFFK